MQRSTLVFLVAVATIGSWLFFRNLEVEQLPWPSATPLPGDRQAELALPVRQITIPTLLPKDPRYLRIATLDLQLRSRNKADDPIVQDHYAVMLAQFDVIAIQGLAPDCTYGLGTIVDLLNATGRRYDYLIGPAVGRQTQECFAFVFDTERVDVDRYELYSIEDPDDLLNAEPLVAWFRARQPAADQAFTFTLVNCHTDVDEADRENAILGSVFREVRNDRRGEDDVLLLGNFEGAAERLAMMMRLPDPVWAVTDVATNTRATAQLDNIVASRQFTDEATGRSGVFDFLRELNLPLEHALLISEHLPVWMECTLVEGGRRNTDWPP